MPGTQSSRTLSIVIAVVKYELNEMRILGLKKQNKTKQNRTVTMNLSSQVGLPRGAGARLGS